MKLTKDYEELSTQNTRAQQNICDLTEANHELSVLINILKRQAEGVTELKEQHKRERLARYTFKAFNVIHLDLLFHCKIYRNTEIKMLKCLKITNVLCSMNKFVWRITFSANPAYWLNVLCVYGVWSMQSVIYMHQNSIIFNGRLVRPQGIAL